MNDRICKFKQMTLLDRKFEIMATCNRLARAVFTGNCDLGRRITSDLVAMCHEMELVDESEVMEVLK